MYIALMNSKNREDLDYVFELISKTILGINFRLLRKLRILRCTVGRAFVLIALGSDLYDYANT